MNDRTLAQSDVSTLSSSDDRASDLTAAPFHAFTDFPQKLIHELFEDQAARTPRSVAVVHEQRSVTYAELNGLANRLARELRDAGVRADQPVGVCMERSPEMIVALLAILKAGGAYVPLDPSYPAERLQYMVADAQPRVILIHESLRERVPVGDAQLLALESTFARQAARASENLSSAACGATPANLLYVIYTSGSTGRPKGIAMPHGAMVNLIEWQRGELGEGGQPRVLQFAALSFDVAFQEIFSTLCTGGTLVLLDEWTRRDAGRLLELLQSSRIERLFLPPLMLRTLAEAFCAAPVALPTLRDVITAGEQLRITPEIVQLFARLDGCRLHNHYGPTETHVVTALTLSGEPASWPLLPSIGRPIANTQIHLLDESGQPVATGDIGEIHIGGANVARGYLHRSELTTQRFIRDSFASNGHARLYKTGDVGRRHADGTIEYLGRNDDQVKIRGFRIELGEIEAQLALHPGVNEAAVVARAETKGEKHLLAYVTARSQSAPSVEALRLHLERSLPEHMIPRAFVVLESLPVTPSGKVDRRALPAPGRDAYVLRPYSAPENDAEILLARVWQSLLHVERVGRDDNFFALGGHSLLVAQMLEHLRRAGLVAEIRAVFDSATLAELAAALKKKPVEPLVIPPKQIPAGCEQILPEMLPLLTLEPEHIERITQWVPGGAGNVEDIYPLAPLQEGILFHHLLDRAGGDTYIVTTLLSVSSRERMDQLLSALQAVIDRHDVLRTAVQWEQLPQPVQVVHRRAELPVDRIALRADQDPLAQVRDLMKPERQRMDIRQAPLLRVQVAYAASGEIYALLRFHHIAIDHLTFDLVTAEAIACLEGCGQLLPEPIPYRHHVARTLAHARAHDAEAFFRGKLADIDEATAPFGLLDVHGDGARIAEASERLDPVVARRLRASARKHGVSAATLFHAAWSLVVARTSGRDDVVFGSMLLGRLQGDADIQRSLGMFINTLPLRLSLGNMTVEQLVQQTRQEIAELLQHDQAPLALAQRCSRIVGATPLFSTLLNYVHGLPDARAQWSSVSGIEALQVQERTNYPITVSVEDVSGGFMILAQTDRRLDPRRIVGYVRTAVQSLIDALEVAPRTLALALHVLPEEECRQLLATDMRRPSYEREQAIHELFEQQVRRNPKAVAVVYEGQRLTYGELNARANQLAHYLVDRGIRPDQLVGICIDRSLDMIVGLVGILKAGAGYLPLDPNYPPERIAFMLDDAQPRAVLTDSRLAAQVRTATAEVIALDASREQMARQPTDDLDVRALGLRPDHLAYVIYTSGSTGKPKGVMVEHRNVTRLFAATEHWFHFDERDVWTLFHSIAFDFSVWELWGALLYGGQVVVVPYATVRAPREFYRLLCEHGATVLNQTPSAFAQLIDAQAHEPRGRHSLRLVIFGGEALEPRVLRPWVTRNGAHEPLLVNMYGITETTVHVTYHPVTAEEIESGQGSLIGEPIPDLRVYLLNRHGQPVPSGVVGEMYVGGAGVSRGYLNRPELTAERFIADRFEPGATSPAITYRSGDLGRRDADGTLEYLGRNDNQVKIRGFRIELGEVESALLRQAHVKDAAVLAREDVAGEKRLVAYVTAFDSANPPDLDVVRVNLRHSLPEYMVPAAFMLLEQLPLTSNGKLDRRALPAPGFDAYVRREYIQPQGESEEVLAAIWQELLHVQRAGCEDDFFELGGHSLLAMQVLVRVEARLAVELPMRTLFQYPRLRELAAHVDELRRTRLSQRFEEQDDAVADLLEQVTALPDSEVEQLLRQLRTEGTP